MKITVKYKKIQFSRKAFEEALSISLRSEMRNASVAFVQEALEHVPIDTGQARGTFLPFARLLRTSVPTPGAVSYYNKKQGTLKSVASGADPGNQLLFQFSENQYGHYLKINAQLEYFLINDQNSMNYSTPYPTPWNSLKHGKEAFAEYLKGVSMKIPKYSKYIKVVR